MNIDNYRTGETMWYIYISIQRNKLLLALQSFRFFFTSRQIVENADNHLK